MKLRNKKTGEVVETNNITATRDDGTIYYDSLAELNEDWEDYEPNKSLGGITAEGAIKRLEAHFDELVGRIKSEPKEPLLGKDIRGIFRQWAEINGIETVVCKLLSADGVAEFVGWKEPNARGIEIDLPVRHMSMKIGIDKEYTIAELCGEDE